jgi:hypothetical protein
MFRLNPRTQQPALLSDLNLLPAHQRERLENSWAGTFRREVFARLDERPFAVLYSTAASRPNIPINVLVSLEALKVGFNWSDAELLDAFLFNLQVRYAVGYENLGDGEFDLRTVYHFRRRLSEHERASGVSLFDQAFAQITDAQVTAFQVTTGRLRMDSTQIASNVRHFSRLQLLVEIAQRVYRMLSEPDQARYAERFQPYLRGTSGQFIYHLKGETTTPHLQHLGELFHDLVRDLEATYAAEETYQLLVRVFREHFEVPDPAPDAPPCTPKPGTALSPVNVHSPDDLDVTYRRKGGATYEGYVANVTETCDPDNPFQLIVLTQTAPNTTEDTTLLCEALPALTARTEVHILDTDGGFGGRDVDAALRPHGIIQIQSAFRGQSPDPDRLTFADFEPLAAADAPPQFTCPHGQTATLELGRKPERFIARFDCPPDCPLLARCPTRAHRTDTQRSLHLRQADLDLAQRRRNARAARAEPGNLRAAVEATVAALKRPFAEDQLPVRGRYRIRQLISGSALMVNLRRIHRYLSQKVEEARTTTESEVAKIGPVSRVLSFFVGLRRFVHHRRGALALGC